MKNNPANKFFDDINFVSIVDTIRNVYMSDGSMSTLLDFERCLDEADVYAYPNWINGELVSGPNINRYTASCVFMWPKSMMPDIRGARRLVSAGCRVTYGKSTIKVPVEVVNYDDLIPGTNYPKMKKHHVWFVKIEIPLEIMNDIKEGSIELADQTIDLSDIEEAYVNDMDDASFDTDDQDDAGQNTFGDLN